MCICEQADESKLYFSVVFSITRFKPLLAELNVNIFLFEMDPVWSPVSSNLASSTTNSNNSTFSMNYNFVSSNATSTTSASSSTSSSSPKQKEQEVKQVHKATLLNNQTNRRQQNFNSYRNLGTPIQMPDMSTMNANQATAYLVQTIDGNTLLIPHSASISNGVFMQNNQNSISRMPMELVLQQHNQQQTIISTSNLERPESNVYQTIENDR